MATLNLPFSIKELNPLPVDAYYYNTSLTGYTNTAQVLSQVTSAARYLGQTFFVNGVEYWFATGITNGDLVTKGSVGGITALTGDVTASGSGSVAATVNAALNKAWTGTHSFLDNSWSLLDNSDNTKILAFQLSGITTGTTRTYSWPDFTGNVIVTGGSNTLSATTDISTGSNTFSIKNANTDFKFDPTNAVLEITTTGMGASVSSYGSFGITSAQGFTFSNTTGDLNFSPDDNLNLSPVNGNVVIAPTVGDVVLTLGSDANEDIYVRRGGVLTRIPVGTNTDVLTVTAGTVGWAAPSGGGGITNGAANTELMVSNGTNAIGGKIFSPSNGNLTLGDTGLAGNRTLIIDGSAATVDFTIQGKGSNSLLVDYWGNLQLGNSGAATSGNITVASSSSNANFLAQSKGTGEAKLYSPSGTAGLISGGNTISLEVNGATNGIVITSDNSTYNKIGGRSPLKTIYGGVAEPNSNSIDVILQTDDTNGVTNLSSGNLYLNTGVKAGSGTVGNIGIFTTSGSFGSGEKVVFINNATTNATTAPTNGIILHGRDSSDGSANATLALYLEQAVEAIGSFTATHKIKIWINNVEYWVQLDAV